MDKSNISKGRQMVKTRKKCPFHLILLLSCVNIIYTAAQSSSFNQANYHFISSRNSNSSINLLNHLPSNRPLDYPSSSSSNSILTHSPFGSLNNNLLNLENVTKFSLKSNLQTIDSASCKDIILHPVLYEENCLCIRDSLTTVKIDCDEMPILVDHNLIINPFISISKYTQQSAGLHQLSGQLFATTTNDNDQIQLNSLDLSNNNLKKLARLLDGVESNLEFLNLSHNLLGDNLNPIFSSSGFTKLHSLKSLNLAFNNLRNLDSNLFIGLHQLNVRISL